jgi:hypothetical protein
MRSSAIYINAAHKTVAWRNRREHKATVTSQRSNPKPSGLQISFWKAQKAVEDFLALHDVIAARNMSLRILEGSLSDKQREQLHARKRAKRAATLTVVEQRELLDREDQAA